MITTTNMKVRFGILKLNDLHKLSKDVIKSEQLNWFVVGDKEKILPGLKEMGFDEIILVDGDGKILEKIPTKVKP